MLDNSEPYEVQSNAVSQSIEQLPVPSNDCDEEDFPDIPILGDPTNGSLDDIDVSDLLDYRECIEDAQHQTQSKLELFNQMVSHLSLSILLQQLHLPKYLKSPSSRSIHHTYLKGPFCSSTHQTFTSRRSKLFRPASHVSVASVPAQCLVGLQNEVNKFS